MSVVLERAFLTMGEIKGEAEQYETKPVEQFYSENIIIEEGRRYLESVTSCSKLV